MGLAINVLQSLVTYRSMRPLLEIVANIADRSHVGKIATKRTIQTLYDPV